MSTVLNKIIETHVSHKPKAKTVCYPHIPSTNKYYLVVVMFKKKYFKIYPLHNHYYLCYLKKIVSTNVVSLFLNYIASFLCFLIRFSFNKTTYNIMYILNINLVKGNKIPYCCSLQTLQTNTQRHFPLNRATAIFDGQVPFIKGDQTSTRPPPPRPLPLPSLLTREPFSSVFAQSHSISLSIIFGRRLV